MGKLRGRWPWRERGIGEAVVEIENEMAKAMRVK